MVFVHFCKWCWLLMNACIVIIACCVSAVLPTEKLSWLRYVNSSTYFGRFTNFYRWVWVSKDNGKYFLRFVIVVHMIFTSIFLSQECDIIDFFLPPGTLKDEVLKIMPVQKQTRAGQRTRFKVGHIHVWTQAKII